MRIPPPRVPIDRDELLRLRVEEGLSGAEIARRLGFTARAVRRALKELGVPLRPDRRVSDVRWGERLYGLWCSIRRRCSNPRSPLYPRYGGRGVSICAEWGTFWPFYDWAIHAGYRPGLNIEITGRSRRFSPTSCRWITARQRMRRDGYPRGHPPMRTITAFGEMKSASEWQSDSRCQVHADVLRRRIRAGVPPEKAISLPLGSALPKDGRRVRASKGPRKLLDWKAITELHKRDGLRPAEIANRVGASVYTIRKGLKERGEWRKPKKLGPHACSIRKVWEAVRNRCEDERDPSYRYYGARGARMCAEWRDFRVFHLWAIESGYVPGLCLTRKKGTRVYSPKNCRWITRAEAASQARHPDSSMPARWTVEAFAECKGPTEWSRDPRCRVSLSGLLHRLRSGWRPEDAISELPQTKGNSDTSTHRIRAFGITRGVTDWTRDPRCRVSCATLIARINRGIPPETAIASPPYELPASYRGRSSQRR